jgi:hypothetical protein
VDPPTTQVGTPEGQIMEGFLEELMLFLNEEDIVELTEKAGVRFPIVDPSYEDLCYISCWMSMRRKLPDSIRNRMVLGEPNRWVQIYLAT